MHEFTTIRVIENIIHSRVMHLNFNEIFVHLSNRTDYDNIYHNFAKNNAKTF